MANDDALDRAVAKFLEQQRRAQTRADICMWCRAPMTLTRCGPDESWRSLHVCPARLRLPSAWK